MSYTGNIKITDCFGDVRTVRCQQGNVSLLDDVWCLESADRPKLTIGSKEIAAERQRQIDKEGWTPEHDDEHDKGEISAAASAYAFSAFTNTSYRAFAADPVGFWPWDEQWWKPRTPREDLVRAGALIAAEIDRIDRLKQKS